MRLIAFDNGSGAALGVRLGDAVVDLSVAARDLPGDLRGLLTHGPDALDAARAAAERAPAGTHRPLAEIDYLPPVWNPSKTICVGLNYTDHAAEGGFTPPDYPTLFMRGPSSFVAHGHAIIRPQASTKLDYEAELAVIIGRRARHVAEAEALSVVAGYSIFNDGSVRDYQRRTPQWTIGKNFDRTGAFGPEFVSADELPPGARGLGIRSRLNGQLMQNANTADMIFPVATTIALITECLTLEPGDVLVMGTPAGVGYARTPPVFMRDGDICEIEIEGIGVLSNPVRDEVSAAASTAA